MTTDKPDFKWMSESELTALMSREDIMLFLHDTGAADIGYQWEDDSTLEDLRTVLAAYMFSDQHLVTLRGWMEAREIEQTELQSTLSDFLEF